MKPIKENNSETVELNGGELEKVAGGIKWGDGDRPELQDAHDVCPTGK